MLNLWSNRTVAHCDGGTRRDFLKVGALGMGGLALSDLLRARAQANEAGRPTRNTSVVWLWLGGGPTHVETFDPKMTAPSEFRSTIGATPTNVAGIELGSVFEKTARVADKMAFVRSFAHTNSGHGGGTHWVNTGYNFTAADNGGGQSKPGFGAILSRHRGANNATTGLPTYVRMGGILGDGPSWLGSAYAPFDSAGNARNNMNLQVTMDRLSERRSLLRSFDSLDRQVDRTGLMNGLDSFETQAFDLLLSRARETFDITREDPRTLDLYGSNRLAQQLLLARRLCESGVGFVTLNYGGWDMHGNIAQSMRQTAPALDHAISAFVRDINQRGLADDILLVVTGEFGRTPRVNNNAGRDHWAPLSTLALAGGGLRMGQTVGESNARAEVPKTTPITPQDLMATVFHVLGMPQGLHYNDPTGRPVPMVNGGRPIRELVG
jgi:Protein of unknown function (DUF1501)